MRILSLDSATEAASCAILQDNNLLGEITFNYKKQHSVILLPIIDNLLKDLQLTINDIDGYVVSSGPGSFTGLRIGMATIKGFCQGTNKPFVGVSSLDALANNMSYTSGIICPVLDALRDNVYTALYKFEGEKLVKLTDYMAISVIELIELIREKNMDVSFIGDGIVKHGDSFRNAFPTARFAPSHLNFVRAAALGDLGMKLLKEGVKHDIYTFAPEYFRKSQAEREYEMKNSVEK